MGPTYIQKLLHSKGNNKQMNGQLKEWEKPFSTDKRLVSKIYKHNLQTKFTNIMCLMASKQIT